MSERGRCGLKEAVKLILRVTDVAAIVYRVSADNEVPHFVHVFPPATEASIGSRTWWPSTWTTCTT